MPAPIPIIFLAFANDRDDYLELIVRERDQLFKYLQTHHDRGYLQVHKEEYTSIKKIFETFNRYAGRIAIFHYGGHAGGTHLKLEPLPGHPQKAYAEGLARLMGLEKDLQLVFLNGCATRGQVKRLFAAGVKAVIATSVSVQDQSATEFAEQFYQALASRASIGEAFEKARAFLAAKQRSARRIEIFRKAYPDGSKAADAGDCPWGLYINENGEAALNWKLPETSKYTVTVQGSETPGKPAAPQNRYLINTLIKEIAEHNKDVQRWLEFNREQPPDIREIRQHVIDSFPAPIGLELRRLLTGDETGPERLRRLLFIYDAALQFLSFIVLSQLWEARYRRPDLPLDAEAQSRVKDFLFLEGESQAAFDYLGLIDAVAQVLCEHRCAHLIEECAQLREISRTPSFGAAHQCLESIREKLTAGTVPAGELEELLLQGEKSLADVLAGLIFLVKYKLAAIKRIELLKIRYQNPQYRHKHVLLDKVMKDFMDQEGTYPSFTDSESVLLLKTVADVSEFLSLSPFLIDENAFTGDQLSKLYLYAYRDAARGEYVYRLIYDPQKELRVSDHKYPQVKALIEAFSRAVNP